MKPETTPTATPEATRVATGPRILVCDDLAPVALDVFRERGLEPEVRVGLDEAALASAARDVDALVVRSSTRITRRVIEGARRLKVVGRAGVGVDNVDCDAATERGVVVMNTPTGNTITTAELAIALLCALARHVPRADRNTRAGNWKKSGLVGTELTGKTLGVVGLGRIGRVVAERALGLKMRVVASDPYLSETGAASPLRGVELVPLDALLREADFVSLHVPLLDSTRNLLSAERLALMKPGARLVNAARGGLVDEAALARALDEGRLAGAALDVLEEEPPPAGHPLVGRDDVILTPHLGASSEEAQYNVARDIARQIADFLLDGVANNAVNAPAVAPGVLEEIAPYILLAEKIGAFLAQLADEPIRKLELTLSGEVAGKDARPIALALQVGVLKQGMDSGVNFVNAPLLAKERGLRLFESVSEEAHFFHGQIKVRASSRGGAESHLVAGTVFGREPRFVRIDHLHLDLEPRGTILITRHRDEPGVVGLVGTVLGQRAVNIRRIELGQGSSGGLASGFFALYEEPALDVLQAIAVLDPIVDARLVRL
jgi:D-3-phosphoglycerate dehydrogenase